MTPFQPRLNPALDRAAFAEAYRRDGIVQVPDFFDAPSAEAIAALLERQTPWNVVCPGDRESTLVITPEVVEKFGQARMDNYFKDVLRRASKEFSYLHMAYSHLDEYAAGRDVGSPHRALTEFMMGQEFLGFGRDLIGAPRVTHFTGKASFYRPGDFIGLHDDIFGTDNRLAAFTIGFTRQWRPDWGGQLLIHDDRGEVERGYMPGFNVLTVFRIPKAHSVAPVAPYAAAPRISLTGWYLDGEKPAALPSPPARTAAPAGVGAPPPIRVLTRPG